MDVKTTFINEEFNEEIYMQQLLDFVILGQEQKACKLQNKYRAKNNPLDYGI